MIGDYVTATLTQADGTFALRGVPTGKQVPVTVQLQKWRRTIYVDVTHDCGVNPVVDGALRLPRGRSEKTCRR